MGNSFCLQAFSKHKLLYGKCIETYCQKGYLKSQEIRHPRKLIKTQGFDNVPIDHLDQFFLEALVQKILAVRLLRDSFPLYIILGPGGRSEPLACHM